MSHSSRWAEAPDCGLIAPDQVFYLRVSPNVAASRGGYGQERYEKAEIQARAGAQFDQLRHAATSSTGFWRGIAWEVIDADRSLDDVQETLVARTKALVSTGRSDDPLKVILEGSA
jgi:dTMP kinase